MARPVRYRKPRRLNIVSITLLAMVTLAGYLATQYIPSFLLKHDVYRVLEETSSHFAGRKAYYLADAKAREHLRDTMLSDLRRVGMDDPESEVWIEVEGVEVRFGALYSRWIVWPRDILPKQEQVYEVEYTLHVK